MLGKFLKLTLFQFAFVVVIVLIITIFRFFLPQAFDEYKERYDDLFYFDTDFSLVDGEES